MDQKRYNERLASEARTRRRAMAKLAANGKTYEQIAERFGITRQRVYYHLKRLREWKAQRGRKANGRKPARSVRR